MLNAIVLMKWQVMVASKGNSLARQVFDFPIHALSPVDATSVQAIRTILEVRQVLLCDNPSLKAYINRRQNTIMSMHLRATHCMQRSSTISCGRRLIHRRAYDVGTKVRD